MYYEQLTNDEKIAVNSELNTRKKSFPTALLLAFILGIFGAHRYYVRRIPTGLMQLGLTVLGFLTQWLLIGYVFTFLVVAWVIIDLFRVHAMVEEVNTEIREEISAEFIENRPIQ